jgi:hypothetical protein
MFNITTKFLGFLYPVLKESLLGKQSLIDAVKTSKIKVLVLAYCTASPFIISYLSNKTVSLASANIALSKKVSTQAIEIAGMITVKDSIITAKGNPAALPLAQVMVIPSIAVAIKEKMPMSSARKTSVAQKPDKQFVAPPLVEPPVVEPEYNYNEILNRRHDQN